MGFIVDPGRKQEALNLIHDIMLETKGELENALPFAMNPVVSILRSISMGPSDHSPPDGKPFSRRPTILVLGETLRTPPADLTPVHRAELDQFAHACRTHPAFSESVEDLFNS